MNDATPAPRASYSYKVVAVPQKLPDAENFLNQLAADGWRLIWYTHGTLGVFEKQN